MTRSGRAWTPATWTEIVTGRGYVEVGLVAYQAETDDRWSGIVRVSVPTDGDVSTALESARRRLLEMLASEEEGDMSGNWLADTPDLAEKWCPRCDPERDSTIGIVEVRYCDRHPVERSGADDGRVSGFDLINSFAEAGGEDNRRWCELIHKRS